MTRMKGVKRFLRRATRNLKKGVRGATRRVRKFFGRGGRRRPTKGPLGRVTNAIRGVGKGFRNSVRRVFSRKGKAGKRRRNRRRTQKGSAENNSIMQSLSSVAGPSPMSNEGNASGAQQEPAMQNSSGPGTI